MLLSSRKQLLVLVSLVGCLASLTGRAQEVGVSNIGEVNAFNLTRDTGMYVGGRFHTGSSADQYLVTGFQLPLMSNNYGITDFNVSLWTSSVEGKPGTVVGTFTGPSSPAQGLIDGLNTFTSAGITVSGDTEYWIVFGASAAPGFYYSVGMTQSSVSTGEWSIGRIHSAFTEGGTGWANFDNAAPRFTLTATAVPEPSTYAMILGLSVLGFVMARRRRR